ncbi:MAG: ATP-binding protein [Thermodesulfobacteriota bacterium]
MNVKNRTFAIVSVVILALCGLLIAKGISHFEEEINLAIRQQEQLIDGISDDIRRHSFDPYLFKIRHFAEHNDQIGQAMAVRDRDLLHRHALPHFTYLRGENPFFHSMSFHLPDGTMLLSIQEPDRFKDDPGPPRPMIVDAHRHKKQRAGFDAGATGAMFRVAQPIFQHDRYLGLVEYAIEARQLEEALATGLRSEVLTILTVTQRQKRELLRQGFRAYGDQVLIRRGAVLPERSIDAIDFSSVEDQRLDIDGRPYVLHSCIHLPDFQDTIQGRLVLLHDISEQVFRKKTFIRHGVGLTLAVLAAALTLLYYSFGHLIGRLEHYAGENTRAREELQIAHDRLDERVRARTLDLAKSNARLEDEVTIRRRTEERLDKQRAFLEAIIESMTNPLYVIDAETYAVIMANKAALALSGSESVPGCTCYRLTHHARSPCSDEGHPCPLMEVKKSGNPVVVEHIHYDNTGEQQFVEVYAYPVFDEHGRVVQVVEYTLDVTKHRRSDEEREKLLSQLIASQKMEAVGILAGGIAHDFNNILTVILGYSQILALMSQEADPRREMINGIHDAAERAAGLTQQLLAFSRRQTMEIGVVNPNDIVSDISRMLTRLIGEDVRMDIAMAENIGNIRADTGQIQQVIMNLVINARDAMPDGGNLTIETGQIELDEKYAASRPGVHPGLYAMITVTDTGIGMTPEVREEIFEPFFTTKKRGEGTGLGLSTVYGIVKQHDGHIYVYSEPGRGTTFKIYLPITDGTADELGAPEHRSMPPGNETILLVDDDASIRRLLRDTLEPLGYDLIEATDGEHALALLEQVEKEIHLVLTDLIMPGMNGRELLDAVKTLRPEIKSILMSGYTDNILLRHQVFRPGVVFLNKPLLPIALANKIRDVLDGTEPPRNEMEINKKAFAQSQTTMGG